MHLERKSHTTVQSRASRAMITTPLSRQSVGHRGHEHQFSFTGISLADITWHRSMSLTVLDHDERHTLCCTVCEHGLTSHSTVYLYIAVCCRLCRRVCSVLLQCEMRRSVWPRSSHRLVSCLPLPTDILLVEHYQVLSFLDQHSQVVGTAHTALSRELSSLRSPNVFVTF